MPMIKAFEKTFEVGAGVTTKWALMPEAQPGDYLDRVMIALGPNSTGTGRFESTAAPRSVVIADNENPGSQKFLIPIPWTPGDVSVKDSAVLEPVTAIRVVNISGDVVATARAI